MKIKSILVILLLMSFSLILASEDPTEAEHWEKVRQLDQLAEKFKAETGFTGTIGKDIELSRFCDFRGKFPSTLISNPDDTLEVRQVFDSILDKVLPYSGVTRRDVTASCIERNRRSISTTYIQLVNGYRFINFGEINIMYTTQSNQVFIGIGTITHQIKPVNINYSFEQAADIVKHHYIMKLGYPDLLNFVTRNYKMRYVKNEQGGYRLCHVFGVLDPDTDGWNDQTAYVDVETGEIILLEHQSVHSYDCEVYGKGRAWHAD